MLKSFLATLVVVMTATLTAGCSATVQPSATAQQESPAARPRPPQSTPFESWAAGNGTGSFFRPLGPAQGTGVRHAWPE